MVLISVPCNKPPLSYVPLHLVDALADRQVALGLSWREAAGAM